MVKQQIKISMIDPIRSTISWENYQKIKPAISYETSYWKTGRFRKEQIFYEKECFIKKTKDFVSIYTGHIDRICHFCENNNLKYKVKGENEEVIIPSTPNLPGITFFPEQKFLINEAITTKRGVIKAPTGIGKTIILLGILSAFPSRNVLILAHSVDLVQQMVDRIKKFKLGEPTQIGGGKKFKGNFGKITVSTIQSFARLKPETYRHAFDIVAVDEVHHVSRFNCKYAKVLGQIDSPIRYGFTATIPEKWETIFAIEAFIGGMIGELTIQEAVDKNLIVKPKVKLIKAEGVIRIKKIFNYQEVYKRGIIENKPRNKQIMKIAKEYTDKGKSVLILITRIEHGENLIQAGAEQGIQPIFIRGSTETAKREEIKEAFINKDIKCVISTTVWKEGVDIPTLDVVIIAGVGKSDTATLQNIGRALRKSEGKKQALIIDFFDNSHRYFIDHFGERVTIYMDNGWI